MPSHEVLHSDSRLVVGINRLRAAVADWLTRHELNYGATLRSFAECFDDEPDHDPVVLVLVFGNDLYRLFDYAYPEAELLCNDLENAIEPLGFYWSRYDGCTVTFHAETETEAYRDYFRFSWLCSLIQPDLVNVSMEVFSHFRKFPTDLRNIEPRALEVLVDGAFRSQGFRTELGPGSGDGGVDIRLYQHDVIGQVQTLVQVKRYGKLPIKLDAVAALCGIVNAERANRGLFVTTSRYLPVAQRFAERQRHLIKLADTTDMVEWCSKAEQAVAQTTNDDWIDSLLGDVRSGNLRQEGLVGRVVHATWGHNMTINDFCLVVRETPGAVLIAPLADRSVEDNRGETGTQVPHYFRRESPHERRIFFGRKKFRDGCLTIWARQRLYSPWDGAPKHFNHVD